MSTQFAMIDIMNAALSSQGLEEIVSLNDGSPEFRLLSRNWPGIIEAEMEDGYYSFSKQQVHLLSRTPGLFGFADGYLVPQSALHVRQLWVLEDDYPREIPWVQDGTRVFVDHDTGVYVETFSSAATDLWSANFTRGVQLKLEAVIAKVKEEPNISMSLEQQAETHFQRARTISSKSRSLTDVMRPGRFALSRFR